MVPGGEVEDGPGVTEACRAVRPALYAAVLPFLGDADPAVGAAAVGAVTSLLKAPDLAGQIPAAADHLHAALADDGRGRRERAAAVLTLGTWKQDTTAHLTDPDPAVRACAALAESCADDPAATAVLLEALRTPAEADHWFSEPLPQLDGWFRFALLEAVVDRVETFEELLPAALALMPMASSLTVDRDWGLLLEKAFPQTRTADTELTPAQKHFLRALADNDACWRYITDQNPWLGRAGLPERREDLRRLL